MYQTSCPAEILIRRTPRSRNKLCLPAAEPAPAPSQAKYPLTYRDRFLRLSLLESAGRFVKFERCRATVIGLQVASRKTHANNLQALISFADGEKTGPSVLSP